MSKPLKQIRWNVAQAAQEFGINPKTLSMRIKREGIEPARDKCFSTAQICSAVFGDIDGEKLLLTRQQRIKLEIENAETTKTLVDARRIAERVTRKITAVKAAILAAANLEREDKDKILVAIGDIWGADVLEADDGGVAASTDIHGESMEREV